MQDKIYIIDTLGFERLFQRIERDRAITEVEERRRLEKKLDSFIFEARGKLELLEDEVERINTKIERLERIADKERKRKDYAFIQCMKWALTASILGLSAIVAAIIAQQAF